MQSDPSNRSKAEMQEFEKHPELTKYIHKMAAFSTSLSPSEWSKFLNELNKALAQSLPPSGEEETAVGEHTVTAAYLKGVEDGKELIKEDVREFAEWTHTHGWEYFRLYDGWKHFNDGHANGVYKTYSQLYTLYLESKTQGK